MAFENDPEGYRIAAGYAGGGFDEPHTVRHDVLYEYDGDWTIEEFQTLIAEAVSAIPETYRASARVEMHDPGYDAPKSLRVYYIGPESPETVADRIKRCEKYVAERRTGERATYERLKAKFG
ncbi:hypothetical protein [Bradyrhizobium elkanii]|uniref:hypothetical protein n=1 Tax=Bradyrhizobium elkanii TaxID=29448 RepID=UPI00216A4076|nr:hypothetical protein [Bradyrhizobium elkanii]MCS3690975.1 hypothetical protein [Bradyrhizobium elkanii]